MAEKEERIAVAKMIVNIDDEGSAELDHFKIYSRQDAINRMEKAMKQYAKDEEIYTDKDLAIVALNALLGESND